MILLSLGASWYGVYAVIDHFSNRELRSALLPVAAILIFALCLWLTTTIVYLVLPWKKPRVVLRLYPEGTSEHFLAPKIQDIGKLIETKPNQRTIHATIHQLEKSLPSLPSTWRLNRDLETQKWYEELHAHLVAKHGKLPAFNQDLKIEARRPGIYLLFSVAEDTNWSSAREDVLIMKR